jgi:integrase
MKHLKITDTDELLKTNVPKVIESHLVDYIISLRKDGVSYAFMKHAVAPIFTFYQLKDILLNRKKIARYFGECKRITKDKAYNTEQIQQALATADHRMGMIILLLASTGYRLGTIQLLPLLA